MKMIIQRVNEAKILFEDKTSVCISKGLLVYLGINRDDTIEDIDITYNKLINTRIFEDENNKLNLSVKDKGYEIMLVSNFTLYGNMKRGNRPSFTEAASIDVANTLYEKFILKLAESGINYVTGRFRTHMEIISSNDGPINLIFDTKEGVNNGK